MRVGAYLRSEHVNFHIFIVFLALLFLGGGASRADVQSLLFVRPAAVLLLAWLIVSPRRPDLRSVRYPLTLILILGGWIVVQLIPLPPSIWTALPGREPIAAGAEVLRVAHPWRPISLAPDLTLNSLISLAIPLAALLGFAALTLNQRHRLVPVFIGASLISCLIGVAQISSGPNSPFHLYRITNAAGAVGVFANRNHQAILLAAVFPMLAVWAGRGSRDVRIARLKQLAAALYGAVLMVMILVTGSRAGLILGGLAAAWASVYYFTLTSRGRGKSGIRRWAMATAAVGLTAVLGGLLAFIASERALSLQRVLGAEVLEEQRWKYIPTLTRMAKDFFPVGSGFGTFDPVYRIYEPLDFLSTSYLNHAHNDLLELLITGGIVPAVILAVYIGWAVWSGVAAWRSTAPHAGNPYVYLGLAIIFILLVGSLVDYPIRIPLLAALMAVASGWVAEGAVRQHERRCASEGHSLLHSQAVGLGK